MLLGRQTLGSFRIPSKSEARATLDHRPQNIPNRNAAALTECMLHMQQKVVMRQARLNVRSCRLASGSTSTHRQSLRTATKACCPR